MLRKITELLARNEKSRKRKSIQMFELIQDRDQYLIKY